MSSQRRESLPYNGESAQDRLAYARYLEDVERGKTALQLQAVAAQLTPPIRSSWSSRTFTDVSTPSGDFDALTCNIAYHFQAHGQRYGSIAAFTIEAQRYFRENRQQATLSPHGVFKLPKGTFESDGRIITYFG